MGRYASKTDIISEEKLLPLWPGFILLFCFICFSIFPSSLFRWPIIVLIRLFDDWKRLDMLEAEHRICGCLVLWLLFERPDFTTQNKKIDSQKTIKKQYETTRHFNRNYCNCNYECFIEIWYYSHCIECTQMKIKCVCVCVNIIIEKEWIFTYRSRHSQRPQRADKLCDHIDCMDKFVFSMPESLDAVHLPLRCRYSHCQSKSMWRKTRTIIDMSVGRCVFIEYLFIVYLLMYFICFFFL